MVKTITPLAVAVGAAFLAAGCTSLTPVDDPVYLRLTDMEARLIRIERVLENESLITLATEVDQLRTEITTLRGQIENTAFEVEGNAERQRNLYLDVDQRLQELEQARGAGPAALQTPASDPFASPQFGGNAGAPSSAATPPRNDPSFAAASGQGAGVAAAAGVAGAAVGGVASDVTAAGGEASAAPIPVVTGSDQQNYDAAYNMLMARNYEAAADAFETFLLAFATSPLAANAQYWLAETYYVRGEYQQALAEFEKVIERYPVSSKTPDAMLKVGYSKDRMDDVDGARTALRQLVEEHPDTTAARLAWQELAKPRFQ